MTRKSSEREEAMDIKKICTLCGKDIFNITQFKNGFVCADCVRYITGLTR